MGQKVAQALVCPDCFDRAESYTKALGDTFVHTSGTQMRGVSETCLEFKWTVLQKVAFQLCLLKALEISGAAEQKSVCVCVWLVFHGMETLCK